MSGEKIETNRNTVEIFWYNIFTWPSCVIAYDELLPQTASTHTHFSKRNQQTPSNAYISINLLTNLVQ